jgi:hypothetical protein
MRSMLEGMNAEGAATFLDQVRDVLNESLLGFRAKDKYFKAQAAIVGAWAASSLLTVILVFSGHSKSNNLGAEVRAENTVGGPILFLTNTSGSSWTDITYTLNGTYVYRQAALPAGDHVALPVRRFRKGGVAGKRAPADTVPETLAVACEQGRFETALALSRPPGGNNP